MQRIVFCLFAACLIAIGDGHAQTLATVEQNAPITVVDERHVDQSSGVVRLDIPLLVNTLSPNVLNISLSFTSVGPGFNIDCSGLSSGSWSSGQSLAKFVGRGIYDGLSLNFSKSSTRMSMPDANGGFAITPPVVINGDGSYFRIGKLDTDSPFDFTFSDNAKSGYYSARGTLAKTGHIVNGTNYVDFVKYADGEQLTLYYNDYFLGTNIAAARLKYIRSSRGYGIQLSYKKDSTSGCSDPSKLEVMALTKIVYFNTADYYCDFTSGADCDAISSNQNAAKVVYDDINGTVTIDSPYRPSKLEMRFGGGGINRLREVNVPGSEITYLYNDSTVSSATTVSGVWNYSYIQQMQEGDGPPYNGTSMTYSYNPVNVHPVLTFSDINFPYPRGQIDELHRGFSIDWNRGKIAGIQRDDGSAIGFEADSRGNIKKRFLYPSSGSGSGPSTILTMSYPIDCPEPKTCNKPITVTDARWNVTTYDYSPQHAGVVRETLPSVLGIQPVRRFSYIQKFARVKNAAGNYVAEAAPIWLKSEERFCRATATQANGCDGGAQDEVVTAYEYGPDSGPNNLLLRSIVRTSEGVSLRTCYGYDALGNKISETSPRAGLTSCP